MGAADPVGLGGIDRRRFELGPSVKSKKKSIVVIVRSGLMDLTHVVSRFEQSLYVAHRREELGRFVRS